MSSLRWNFVQSLLFFYGKWKSPSSPPFCLSPFSSCPLTSWHLLQRTGGFRHVSIWGNPVGGFSEAQRSAPGPPLCRCLPNDALTPSSDLGLKLSFSPHTCSWNRVFDKDPQYGSCAGSSLSSVTGYFWKYLDVRHFFCEFPVSTQPGHSEAVSRRKRQNKTKELQTFCVYCVFLCVDTPKLIQDPSSRSHLLWL